MSVVVRIRNWASKLKRDGLTLWFASRHPRTPWHAKAICVLVVAYALSPIDLIPDFIPVIGYIDDLILLPGLIWLALRLIPPPVLAESRHLAEQWIQNRQARPSSWFGASVIVAVWVGAACAIGYWLLRP